MQALYFLSNGDPVFGAYHPAESSANQSSANQSSGNLSPMAVVLCPPFGQEAIRAHKCLLSLANRLSRQDIHVWRFAYRGTDDSSLWSDEILSLNDWRQDILAAKAELKRVSGCASVMLIGLRLGANLAIDVAQESEDVHSVLLWEPISNGRDYLQTLRDNQREMIDLWHGKVSTHDTEEIEELFSTRYQRSLLAEISQVRGDTTTLQQPTIVVSAANQPNQSPVEAVITRDDMEKRVASSEPDAWKALDDLEAVWWRPQSVNQVVTGAREMFARVESRSWHRQCVPAQVDHRSNSRSGLNEFAVPLKATFEASIGQPLSYRESVVQFGNGGQLTAILTEPGARTPRPLGEGVRDARAPVVILLNAGIVHRVGPFRLHVNLARTLAQHGFASLRLDLSGLGDSRPRTGKLTKDERVRLDVDEAMEYLKSRGLSDRFVLCGLCSGAYHAHQVAIADTRVVGAIFLDGIVFRTLGYFFRHQVLRLLRPRFWRNAIKRRWLKLQRNDGGALPDEGNKLAEAEYFQVNRTREAIAAELQSLKARSTQMLFTYTGDYDDVCGRNQFREMFGFAPSAQVQVDYLAQASHTFRIAAHRQQLCRRIAQWLQERFPPAV